MFILKLLFGLAVVGTLTSTIFLLLTIAGYFRFKRQARQARENAAKIRQYPAVSVLKPVHGLEAQLKENIESFFEQDYPAYEILFAAEREDDPALEVVREVSSRYPKIPTQILLTGKPPWANPPAFAFYRMAEAVAARSWSIVGICGQPSTTMGSPSSSKTGSPSSVSSTEPGAASLESEITGSSTVRWKLRPPTVAMASVTL